MTKIYNKLEIPEPSANLEERIIAAANRSERKFFFPKLAAIAACMAIVFVVLQPEPNAPLVTQENMLSDIEFFNDQYGFDADIS